MPAVEKAYTLLLMAAKSQQDSPSRSWGSGTAAIARLLVAARDPMTQVAIAEATGVTQPRASQVLKQLAEHDVVLSGPEGYVATKRARLLELYLKRSRPALTRPEVPWYGTSALYDQVRAVVRLAQDQGRSVAISADVGPDLLVPWRHPTVAVVYSSRALDLGSARLVPAEGRADASLLLRVTDDSSLLRPFPPWPRALDGVPLADPVQQWRDLLDLGSDDRREAAGRLRQAILEHRLPVAA